ncbi:hypothetical protein [Granulicoccus phenolivorans]|uniref:hypothetical protein n=1 Tax=Granulicoccus phenolivorans TaxID=266854 RepID=UPI000415351D|nr:hypothetical protein [Granulicoccus phenolivorans]
MFGSQKQKQIDELQKRVRDLEGLVDLLAERGNVPRGELEALRGQHRIPEASRVLIQQGKTIEAIKVYRERTGAGLREAKQAIDEYRDRRS